MTTIIIPPLSQWKRWMPDKPVLIGWVVLWGVLVLTYWGTLCRLVDTWWAVPDYGHGFFVPVFAAFLLWVRQDMVDPWPEKAAWLAAVPCFILWAVMRWGIAYFHYDRDADSLFPLLAGITLALGGWRALRWAWPSILFLEFMVPLPATVASMLSNPLQRLATIVSVYVLQTLGIPAFILGGQGNVIQLSDPHNRLEVAQACSGLRMLTVFFAICVGAALLMRIQWWERLIIVVSAVPIAILSNVVRISVDGVLTELISREAGQWVHDNAGWFMMILAMLLIWGEMTLIGKLFMEIPAEGVLRMEGSPSLPQQGSSAERSAAPVREIV